MLPVTIGFIFVDGSILDVGTKGHCRMAYKYIRENNLLEEFENSEYTQEDDFLIAHKGAVKVFHTRGKHYLMVPRPNSRYSQIIKMYSEAGYHVKYFFSAIHIMDISRINYNSTVVIGMDGNYIYNPRRDGD